MHHQIHQQNNLYRQRAKRYNHEASYQTKLNPSPPNIQNLNLSKDFEFNRQISKNLKNGPAPYPQKSPFPEDKVYEKFEKGKKKFMGSMEYKDIHRNPNKPRLYPFNTPALPLPREPQYKPKKPISNPLSLSHHYDQNGYIVPNKSTNSPKYRKSRNFQYDKLTNLTNPKYITELSTSIKGMNIPRNYVNEATKPSASENLEKLRVRYDFGGKEEADDNPYSRQAVIKHQMKGLGNVLDGDVEGKDPYGFGEVKRLRKEFGERFDGMVRQKVRESREMRNGVEEDAIEKEIRSNEIVKDNKDNLGSLYNEEYPAYVERKEKEKEDGVVKSKEVKYTEKLASKIKGKFGRRKEMFRRTKLNLFTGGFKFKDTAEIEEEQMFKEGRIKLRGARVKRGPGGRIMKNFIITPTKSKKLPKKRMSESQDENRRIFWSNQRRRVRHKEGSGAREAISFDLPGYNEVLKERSKKVHNKAKMKEF